MDVYSTGSDQVQPLSLDVDKSDETAVKVAQENPALSIISVEDERALMEYLRSRLIAGAERRSERLQRYMRIDRAISTWQKLSPEDSQREIIEDNSGQQFAIPINIPMLASFLSDMTSYFAEALAPISNPFGSASNNSRIAELTKRLNKDALSRDYYGELVLTVRSLLKYNLGGITVEWDEGNGVGVGVNGVLPDGNSWKSLDPYNTLWDSTIKSPRTVSYRAEWGAYVRLTNRIEIARRAITGEWTNVGSILKNKVTHMTTHRKGGDGFPFLSLYKNPAAAVPTTQGEDAHTNPGGETITDEVTWASFGLGNDPYSHNTNRPHELVTMYCWIVPKQFGLIPDGTQELFERYGVDPDTFIELWRFELIDSEHIVSARPVQQLEKSLSGGSPLIPMFLAYMTDDQLGEAQRSMMEFNRGFQRFSSAMMNIYVAGMRGNVWGVRGIDPSMFDTSTLAKGDTAAILTSKEPGRDVRTGMFRLDSTTGVEPALNAVKESMNLQNALFPNQALPAQVAGLDRAVQSQVATVVQGAQRSLRMMLRLLDSSLMMPSRIEAVRNLQNAEPGVFEQITDEDVAKSLGSGVESMEAERITEALWRLLMGIIQNQEAMQTFDVARIFGYLGRTLNISEDMASFVRPQQPPQGSAQQNPPVDGGEPPAQ